MDVNIKNIIEYWTKSSEEDYKTAETLFKNKRYVHSLFFCHLTIEKIIKALVVKKTGAHAPYIHDLPNLSELAGLNLSRKQLEDLEEIDSFNIKGRYDDYKLKFYKKATKNYTEKYFNKTKELYSWLKKQLTN